MEKTGIIKACFNFGMKLKEILMALALLHECTYNWSFLANSELSCSPQIIFGHILSPIFNKMLPPQFVVSGGHNVIIPGHEILACGFKILYHGINLFICGLIKESIIVGSVWEVVYYHVLIRKVKSIVAEKCKAK